MDRQLQVVVLGIIGRSPFAGVTWQVLHYIGGLRRLGHAVSYIEDTGDWPYDADRNTVTNDSTYAISYIARLMTWCALSDRWAYRSGVDGKWFGLAETDVRQLFAGADVLLNLTGATELRDEHMQVPVRVYLETDPFLRQIEVAQGNEITIDLLTAHTHHFTFGENLGTPACEIPVERFTYHPTRQPVLLDWWDVPSSLAPHPSRCFSTISSWKHSGKDIEWNGETYLWSKDQEFLKFVDVPRLTGHPFQIALAGGDDWVGKSEEFEVVQLLLQHGWTVSDALALSKDILPYRDFIASSGAEFTVAKDQYTRPNTGWFSDRSACYLAAGKPVITQETGFSRLLPTGRGLFAFKTHDDIRAAVEAIEGDYKGNCCAAREIAAEYFAADKVVGSLLTRAGL